MKYSNYWEKRQEERLAITDREVNKNIKQLENALKEASNNLKEEIIKLFHKYATDNQLTYQEALKNVSEVELKNLKKDLAYYIENAKHNATSMREELRRISTRVRVNRLEAYIMQIKMYADNLEGILANDTKQMLQDVYVESYLYNLYSADTLKNVKVNVSFDRPNERQLKTLIEYPWSGKNYSSKIWAKTYDFVDNVSNVITVGLIQGKNSDVIAKELHKAIMGEDGKGGQLYKYKRLVRTESAYIVEQATKQSYEDLDVEKYQFLATLDLRTSKTCQNLDQETFLVKEATVGVNYPPMHCFCRSTTIPLIEWDDEEDDDGVRIARDINGKSVLVKNQSYKQWKNEKSNANIEENKKNDIIKALNDFGIKGVVSIPPKEIETNHLTYDEHHINDERNHQVTKTEAISYIKNAYLSLAKWNGRFENYYSEDGAAFVDVENAHIRTAFKSKEYDPNSKKIVEVMREYGK